MRGPDLFRIAGSGQDRFQLRACGFAEDVGIRTCAGVSIQVFACFVQINAVLKKCLIAL